MPAPATLVGDIHGQFHDLLRIFKIAGAVPETRYVFLGDYVDRGYNSVEVMLMLLCLKVRYPAHVVLLRGNHESRQVSSVYGFYDEVVRKYGNATPWRLLTDVFDFLSLAAVVGGSVFCVHGGLSPEVRLIDELRVLRRRREIPADGPMCDIMWSDPEDAVDGWAVSPRGAGFLFGEKPTREFCFENGVELLCRAH